jgi:hypothetical protein
MNTKWDYLKMLIVMPLIILFNSGDIFSRPQLGQSVAELFSHKFYSETTHADITTFVLTISNLYFLFLFNLLYGTYIVDDYNHSGVYIFSRLRNRTRWYIQKMLMLLRFSVIYASIVVASLFMISLYESINRAEMGKALVFACFICCILCALMVITSSAISLISLKIGSVIAFFLVFSAEALMVLSALLPRDNVIVDIWIYLNPFGGLIEGMEGGGIALFRIIYLTGLVMLLIFIGQRVFARIDVGLIDAEAI